MLYGRLNLSDSFGYGVFSQIEAMSFIRQEQFKGILTVVSWRLLSLVSVSALLLFVGASSFACLGGECDTQTISCHYGLGASGILPST